MIPLSLPTRSIRTYLERQASAELRKLGRCVEGTAKPPLLRRLLTIVPGQRRPNPCGSGVIVPLPEWTSA